MSREHWIIMRGGPKDGWVYDLERTPNTAPAIVGAATFTYEPTDEYEAHEGDGLPVQVYRITGAVRSGTGEGGQ